MANCKICDKKFSFGEIHKIQNIHLQPYDLAYELQVCGDCLVTMNKLRAGETEAYRTIHKQIDSRPNSAVKKFVELWEKVPDEVAEKQEQERKLLEERKQAEQRKKDEVDKNFIISTTPTLEGYRITKYIGILPISTSSSSFFDISLYAMSVNDTIKKLAMAMGGNAVVGMTYTTKREEVLGIGTVVWIEKID